MNRKKVSYWDSLVKTDAQKELLARLRRTAMGRYCERLYNDYSWASPNSWENTFEEEILYRVGYEIGHWYQDLEEYAPNYPDNISPAQIKTAKKWVYDAERILGTGRQIYFGGDF